MTSMCNCRSKLSVNGLSYVIASILLFLGSLNTQWNDAIALEGKTDLSNPAVQAFLDDFFPAHLDAMHVPGAVVVVVSDNEILAIKGYGLADLAKKTPMSADTVVRVGSVSKVVTSVAIAKLIENGRVKPDVDVNTYLRNLIIPLSFGKPITVTNLVTHTAGFDDTVVGMHTFDPTQWQPLGPYLEKELLNPVSPPGSKVLYSSWNYAILGLIIEDVSGVTFPEFMRSIIFEPLGMSSSTFEAIKVPPHIQERLAKGYRYDSDTASYHAYERDYVLASPGVSLRTTARDMGDFLIALLNNGSNLNGTVLKADTVQWMLNRHFSHHPVFHGRAFGPAINYIHGHKVVFHSGNGIGFNSLLLLMPQYKLGFFVSINHAILLKSFEWSPTTSILPTFSRRFIETFLPAGTDDHAHTEAALELTKESQNLRPATIDVSRFAGYYRNSTWSRHSIQKIFYWLLSQIKVDAGIGSLSVSDMEYQPVDELLFRSGKSSFLLFRENAEGIVTGLVLDDRAYDKVPLVTSRPVQFIVASSFLFILLVSAFVQFFLVAGRLIRRSVTSATWPMYISMIGAAVGVAGITWLISFFLGFDTQSIFYGIPVTLKYVSWTLVIAVVLAMFAQVALRASRRNQHSITSIDIASGASMIGLVGLLLILQLWGLLVL